MESYKNVLFIVNPVSGKGKKTKIIEDIKRLLSGSEINYKIELTEKPKHATEIARTGKNDFDLIVAVGGDGTVNEVAKILVHTNTHLGIIPLGSGNGLARNLGVPMDTKKALDLIFSGVAKAIDTVKVNSEVMLSTAGLGFDAYVSWKFANSKKRGVLGYYKIVISRFYKYRTQNYTLLVDGEKRLISDAFLITFANSKQFGNDIYISADAKMDDGQMRLVILKKFPLLAVPKLSYYVLKRKLNRYKRAQEIVCRRVELENHQNQIHIDGEPVETDKNLVVEVDPSSLKVLIPKV
jgi:diacylglycerol kinase (ATP)